MKRSIVFIGFAIVFVAGCAAPPGHINAGDVAKLKPGMTKAEVLDTLGKPEYGVAVDEGETLMYVVDGRPWRDRPFEVKLVDGIVQSYTVAEPDPAKADSTAASFKQQIAVPWYSEEDYARMVVLLPATERQEASPYAQWQAATAIEEGEIRSAGQVPVRVVVEPAEVESWCTYHAVPLNRDAIAAFAGMKLGLERGSSGMKATVASDVGGTGSATANAVGLQATEGERAAQ